MSSQIPQARELINAVIDMLGQRSYSKHEARRDLREALKLMHRKPRGLPEGEVKARKVYMTKAMRAKVRKYRELNPDVSARKIAGVFGTDLHRTRMELGELQ